jgi:hypothetical protein
MQSAYNCQFFKNWQLYKITKSHNFNKMLDKDSIILGVFLGLAIPFVGYALILTLFEQIAAAEWLNPETRTISFRSRTIAVLAICLNIIPFKIYQKRWQENTMRGIIIATLVYVGVWVYQFAGGIFQ